MSAWNDGPGNKRDRLRFAALPEEQRQVANARAAQFYDGSRTIARCWTLALDEAEHRCGDPLRCSTCLARRAAKATARRTSARRAGAKRKRAPKDDDA